MQRCRCCCCCLAERARGTNNIQYTEPEPELFEIFRILYCNIFLQKLRFHTHSTAHCIVFAFPKRYCHCWWVFFLFASLHSSELVSSFLVGLCEMRALCVSLMRCVSSSFAPHHSPRPPMSLQSRSEYHTMASRSKNNIYGAALWLFV